MTTRFNPGSQEPIKSATIRLMISLALAFVIIMFMLGILAARASANDGLCRTKLLYAEITKAGYYQRGSRPRVRRGLDRFDLNDRELREYYERMWRQLPPPPRIEDRRTFDPTMPPPMPNTEPV